MSSAKFFLLLLSSARMGVTASFDKFYFEITYLSDPSPIITLPCLSLSSKLKFGQDIKVEFAHLSRPWSIGWVALSFLFVCLFVRPSRYGNTQSNLHFFQYIQALKPHINPVPLNSKQYQVILTQYHQVPTSTDFYWPRTIICHIQMSSWDQHSCKLV